jgi:hypothetical protein
VLADRPPASNKSRYLTQSSGVMAFSFKVLTLGPNDLIKPLITWAYFWNVPSAMAPLSLSSQFSNHSLAIHCLSTVCPNLLNASATLRSNN